MKTMFETGYSEIDNQHRMLFELIEKMKSTNKSFIDEFLELSKSHFQFEDTMMDEINEALISEEGNAEFCNYFDSHRDQHADSIKKIAQLGHFKNLDPNFDLASSIHLLEIWLQDHIITEDAKLVEKLKIMKIPQNKTN